MVVNYVTEWIQEKLVTIAIKNLMLIFLDWNIIYCFGIQKSLIFDNGSHFVNVAMQDLTNDVKTNNILLQKDNIIIKF